MGRRGIGAVAKKRPKTGKSQAKRHPWLKRGLSRADRVIAFCETLPITAGPFAGTKLKLRPWQRDIIREIYDVRRLIRTAVISVARKNGKTQLASCLALAHLCGPEAEPRGEVYSIATTRFQAGRVFNEMCAIVKRVPWMSNRINIIRFRKELEDDVTDSTFSVLSSDVGPIHGLSPSCTIYDELGQASSRELYDALATAMGARAAPLMIVISTQSASDLAPMSELIDHGLRIQRGEIEDPHFHLTLYTAPLDSDPWAVSTWRLSNPGLDDIRSLEDVQRLAKAAQRMPSSEGAFRQYILNQRCETTSHFIEPAVWKACLSTERPSLRGQRCWGGLDLGSAKDLSALVVLFEDGDGGYHVRPIIWLPGDVAEAEHRDRTPYGLWVRQGFLKTFNGHTTDPAVIASEIARLHGEHKLEALAFDRWRISEIKRELDAIGCDVTLVEHGMGFKEMAPAIDRLERLIVERKLKHDGNPVLTAAITGVKIELDAAGNRKPSKRASTARIDSMVALTVAAGITTAEQEREPSYQMFVI